MGSRKIGILGGTFDPVHNGHIKAAQAAYDKLKLDEVIFIPTGIPPHKLNRTVQETDKRIEMIMLAISQYEYFSVSDIEAERAGYTYTVDTLRQMKDGDNKYDDLFFIIGADVVCELNTWKQYKEVYKLCKFIALLRPGYDRNKFYEDVKTAESDGAEIIPVEAELIDISSSTIRNMISKGESVKEYIDENVEDYIKERGLYL